MGAIRLESGFQLRSPRKSDHHKPCAKNVHLLATGKKPAENLNRTKLKRNPCEKITLRSHSLQKHAREMDCCLKRTCKKES